MLSENLRSMHEWFVAAYNSEAGLCPVTAQKFADVLHAQSEKAKRLEAALLTHSTPLTTKHLEASNVVLFPKVKRPVPIHRENKG